MANTLLASAPDLKNITMLIEKFYCGTKIEVQEDGKIRRLSDGKILTGVLVLKKGKRYRFEMEETL